ncbi:MAG: 50S ribosomal protein L9 [Clostridium sp.]|nr:50S ribosomal protein L9 [Clostridium sp.]
MKVILSKDVKSLGKKGDVVDINDGYARNYILPQKLGVEASNKNMNDLKLQKAKQEKIAQEQLEKAQELAREMEGDQVVLSIRAGEGGRTFGSVSTKEIAQGYKEQCGREIDKKKIILPEAIKSFGVFEVAVKLHPKVTGKLKVKVTEMKG